MLAQHPDIQEQIHGEITRTLGPGTVPTAEDVSQLPLIRGLVKETLRYVLPRFICLQCCKQHGENSVLALV